MSQKNSKIRKASDMSQIIFLEGIIFCEMSQKNHKIVKTSDMSQIILSQLL